MTTPSEISDLLRGLNNWPAALSFLTSIVTVIGGVIVMIRMVIKALRGETPDDDSVGKVKGAPTDLEELDAEIENVRREAIGVKSAIENLIPSQFKDIERRLGETSERIRAIQRRLEKLTDIMIEHFRLRRGAGASLSDD